METLFRALDPTIIKELYIKDSSFSRFPSAICKCAYITKLRASNGKLQHLPSDFGNLSHLKDLNLKNNHLTSLPLGFGNLSALQKIDLSNNYLTSLPARFGNLFPTPYPLDSRFLRSKMTLFGSPVITYPEIIMRNIEPLDQSLRDSTLILDLSNNRLTTLPPDFGNMMGLEKLSLAHNELAELPPEFGNMGRLRDLDMRFNRLRDLPPSFGQMRALRRIDLSDNLFSHFPAALEELAIVEIILLWRNPIKFTDITNWKFMQLDSCRVSGVFYIDWWRVEPPSKREIADMCGSFPPGWADWYKFYWKNADEDCWFEWEIENLEFVETARESRPSPYYHFGAMEAFRMSSGNINNRIKPRPVSFYFSALLDGLLDSKYFDRIKAEATGVQKKFLLEKIEKFPETHPAHFLIQNFHTDLEIKLNNANFLQL